MTVPDNRGSRDARMLDFAEPEKIDVELQRSMANSRLATLYVHVDGITALRVDRIDPSRLRIMSEEGTHLQYEGRTQ